MSLFQTLPQAIHEAVLDRLDSIGRGDEVMNYALKGEATRLAAKMIDEALAAIPARDKVVLMTEIDDLEGMTFADEIFGEYDIHWVLNHPIAAKLWKSIGAMVEELRSETATPATVRNAIIGGLRSAS